MLCATRTAAPAAGTAARHTIHMAEGCSDTGNGAQKARGDLSHSRPNPPLMVHPAQPSRCCGLTSSPPIDSRISCLQAQWGGQAGSRQAGRCSSGNNCNMQLGTGVVSQCSNKLCALCCHKALHSPGPPAHLYLLGPSPPPLKPSSPKLLLPYRPGPAAAASASVPGLLPSSLVAAPAHCRSSRSSRKPPGGACGMLTADGCGAVIKCEEA